MTKSIFADVQVIFYISPPIMYGRSHRPIIALLVLLGTLLFCREGLAQYTGNRLSDTIVIAKNFENPWEIELLSEDTAIVSSLLGDVVLVDLKTGQKTVIYTLTDIAQENQSGLMGMAIHPDYPDDNRIYLASTYYDSSYNILFRVQYLRYNKESGALEDPVNIIDSIPSSQSSLGGRIGIGSDMKLYITMGDIGYSNHAQDMGDLHGKILRYNLDGSIPGDNPVNESPIYTMGHRNPQGFCEGRGKLYISEHGPFTNDEINILEPGRNYGWPLATGFCDDSNRDLCDSINMMEPIKTWTPNIAPAGITYYDHPSTPYLQNSLLVAALAGKAIMRLKLDQEGESVIEASAHFYDRPGRIRDIEVSRNGKVYFITSNTDIFGSPSPGDDKLYKLSASYWTSRSEQRINDLAITKAGDRLIIECEGAQKIEWAVFSVSGKKVMHDISEDTLANVSLDRIKPGIYIVTAKTAESSRIKKISIF